MKTTTSNRPVIVGMFVVLGILIFILAIFTLGKEKKTFVKSFTLNAIFDDVGGLKTGGNVWLSGVIIGNIKSIDFYGDKKVLVTMKIEKNAESHIRKNSKAKIGSDGLIGNKIVVIYGGDFSKPPIAKNGLLQVENGLSNEDIVITFQENNKNVLEITKDFKEISDKINKGKGTLAALINDPTIANSIKLSTANLQATLKNLQVVSEKSLVLVSNVESFSDKLNAPGNSMHDLAADKILYGSIKSTLAELHETSGSLNLFTQNLKKASEKLNQNNNAAGLLLNDTETAKSLKNTMINLESGSKKLDQDLEAIQHNFLLRKFFKTKKPKTDSL